jgi:hypothetical protein
MKKFKSILALTASVLALSAFAAPVSAFAAGSDTYTYPDGAWDNNGDGTISLTKNYNEGYVVTIPADVSFTDDNNNSVTGTVTVTGILLGANKTLTVSTSCSGTLKLGGSNAEGTPTVAYSAVHAGSQDGLSSGATISTTSAPIITVNSGQTDNVTEYIKFSIGNDATPTTAGAYSDTMTFTIAYN